jgi:hypothetical protein
MKVLLIQKLKSQTIGVLHPKIFKKTSPTFLGKWGRFEKEIVKLITIGKNK